MRCLSLQEVGVHNLPGGFTCESAQCKTVQQRGPRPGEQPQLQHRAQLLPQRCQVGGQS